MSTASVSEFPAIGRIMSVTDDAVIFQPANSSYELRLLTTQKNDVAVGQRVEGIIRVNARKVYTVLSGGNFVSPIFGPPRTIQGRVKRADEQQLVIHAGVPIVVQLPATESAVDLVNGPLGVGALVNVAALLGATFELASGR